MWGSEACGWVCVTCGGIKCVGVLHTNLRFSKAGGGAKRVERRFNPHITFKVYVWAPSNALQIFHLAKWVELVCAWNTLREVQIFTRFAKSGTNLRFSVTGGDLYQLHVYSSHTYPSHALQIFLHPPALQIFDLTKWVGVLD